MRTIYKYPIEIQDEFRIVMPTDSEPLHVGMQGDRPYLWVLVNPMNECIQHQFYLMGTGHIRKVSQATYVGTFQMAEGRLVFHLFWGGEVIPL